MNKIILISITLILSLSASEINTMDDVLKEFKDCNKYLIKSLKDLNRSNKKAGETSLVSSSRSLANLEIFKVCQIHKVSQNFLKVGKE